MIVNYAILFVLSVMGLLHRIVQSVQKQLMSLKGRV